MLYAILQYIYTGLKFVTDAQRVTNAAIDAWKWICRNIMNIHEEDDTIKIGRGRDIKVIITQGDIADEDVDVIVNGVNCRLEGGAVAFGISMEAGKGITEEKNTIFRDLGWPELEVTKVVHTGGHNLKAKYVLHAVGPPKIDSQFQYLLLKKTFYNCLEYADVTLGVASIAIPLIGSGVVGGSKKECALMLILAVKKFSENNRFKTVNEIRLVNIDAEATNEIKTCASRSLTNRCDLKES